jgi:hypothetical protein
MNKLKEVDSKSGRFADKKICKLWLNPAALTAKQIRETIDSFAAAVDFTLDIQNDEDYVASDISILIDDIIDPPSFSPVRTREEQDKEILDLVQSGLERQKTLRSLAQRVIKQINVDVRNYKNEATNRGYCKELIRRS